jgi:actin cytoskeleton-regulatory complex protein SLA1
MRYAQSVKALFDYNAQTEEELSFKEDDTLYVLQIEGEETYDNKDWWLAKKSGMTEEEKETGWIPSNYVAEVSITL